jgi:hypothetical protein
MEPCLGAFYLGEKRIFPVIFRGQISRCGSFWDDKFSTGIDSRELRNNLQGLEGNLYPQGIGGRGTWWGTDRLHP